MLLPSQLASVTLSSSTPPSSLSFSDVQIGNFSLVGDGFSVNKISNDDLGRMDYETFKTPRGDGGGVLNRYYRGYDIQINITIIADTKESLQQKMDNMKKGISGLEDYLYIRNPNDHRKIKGTVTNIVFNREHYHVTFIKATITFNAVNPFFEDIISQSQSRTTSVNFTEEFLHNGTANSLPRIFFNFSTASVTAINITVNGSILSIVNIIDNNDIVIIDSQDKTVKLNGSSIDFTGIFPVIYAGRNEIIVNIAGTFQVDYTIIAPKTFL